MIALHLVSAALIPTQSSTARPKAGTLESESGVGSVPEEKTAVLCYNVRGVGKSEGRQAWLGAGEADYGAVEKWGLGVTGVKEVWRFVSSFWSYLPSPPTSEDVHTPVLKYTAWSIDNQKQEYYVVFHRDSLDSGQLD